MACSPSWKVYDASGKYVAACKSVEDAACLVAFRGDGATIRYAHCWTIWTEGAEAQSASESYDTTAKTCMARVQERQQAAYAKARGSEETRKAIALNAAKAHGRWPAEDQQ